MPAYPAPRSDVLSAGTALWCLETLSKSTAPKSPQPSPILNLSETTSISALSMIARDRGLDLQLKELTWAGLISPNSLERALLVLRNRNVVLVLQNRCDQQDQIVVADPLYRNGEAFLLPVTALEH